MNAHTPPQPSATAIPYVGLSFDEAMRRVDALDLSDVEALMRQHHDWTEERLASAVLWYRRFLVMNAVEPGAPIISTQDVDDVWHTHVLHTKLYFAHCADVFGYYLHHGPVIRDGRESMDPYIVAFQETLQKCDRYFGARPPLTRKANAAELGLHDSQMVCTGNGDCAPGVGMKLDASQMTCFGNGDCAPGIGIALTREALAA